MTHLPVLGLSGVAGAGKDTVYDRLVAIHGPRFHKRSVADPLKEAMAALFDVSTDFVEEMKRDTAFGIQLVHEHKGGLDGPATMRTMLQRMGTEVGRNLFGEDFWLDQWTRYVQEHAKQSAMRRVGPYTYVNTSVRFENEARRILEMGGEVWHIYGPQDEGAGGHVSEAPLPAGLVTRTIDNSVRVTRDIGSDLGNGSPNHVPDFSYLDDQIAGLA